MVAVIAVCLIDFIPSCPNTCAPIIVTITLRTFAISSLITPEEEEEEEEFIQNRTRAKRGS